MVLSDTTNRGEPREGLRPSSTKVSAPPLSLSLTAAGHTHMCLCGAEIADGGDIKSARYSIKLSLIEDLANFHIN